MSRAELPRFEVKFNQAWEATGLPRELGASKIGDEWIVQAEAAGFPRIMAHPALRKVRI